MSKMFIIKIIVIGLIGALSDFLFNIIKEGDISSLEFTFIFVFVFSLGCFIGETTNIIASYNKSEY